MLRIKSNFPRAFLTAVIIAGIDETEARIKACKWQRYILLKTHSVFVNFMYVIGGSNASKRTDHVSFIRTPTRISGGNFVC